MCKAYAMQAMAAMKAMKAKVARKAGKGSGSKKWKQEALKPASSVSNFDDLCRLFAVEPCYAQPKVHLLLVGLGWAHSTVLANLVCRVSVR